jgi:hypothetical protein
MFNQPPLRLLLRLEEILLLHLFVLGNHQLAAAQEFLNNDITNMSRLRALSIDALDMFIKQKIQHDNQDQGLFIPIVSQQNV